MNTCTDAARTQSFDWTVRIIVDLLNYLLATLNKGEIAKRVLIMFSLLNYQAFSPPNCG
jgi:hypothetical protein